MHINDEVESIYRHINNMLRTGDFSDLDMVLEMRDRLSRRSPTPSSRR